MSFIFVSPPEVMLRVNVSVPVQPLWLVSSFVAVNSDNSMPLYTKADVTTLHRVLVRLILSMACIIRAAQPARWPTSLSTTDRMILSGWFRAPLILISHMENLRFSVMSG